VCSGGRDAARAPAPAPPLLWPRPRPPRRARRAPPPEPDGGSAVLGRPALAHGRLRGARDDDVARDRPAVRAVALPGAASWTRIAVWLVAVLVALAVPAILVLTGFR